jgi:hypothetical protein
MQVLLLQLDKHLNLLLLAAFEHLYSACHRSAVAAEVVLLFLIHGEGH